MKNRITSAEAAADSEQKAEVTTSSPNNGNTNVSGSLLSELEDKKKAAFKRIDEAYYNRNSPHYKDNERYSLAVKTIHHWTVEDCR